MKFQRIKLLLLSIFCTEMLYAGIASACTDEFKPVCGYWMHTSKTQSFANECKMREAGAKIRHSGSCSDKNSAATSMKPNTK
jgi:hypothetical protein